ncbi:MAG: 50S ribosomal protein L3 [Pseudomonadales bacterium]
MTIGLVGRKSGMTRVFTDDGISIPVTVVEVTPNRVTRVKTGETDGYAAIQVTTGVRKASRVSKADAGQFAKAGVEAGRSFWEFRLQEGDEAPEVGVELTVATFEAGQKVDVTGQSKGKGFQGGIKRWNFTMQDATHGNSISHRSNGSIGMCQTPGRVFKGKKMSGHMGAERVTVQTLEVVRVDEARNLILIKGAIPGAPGGDVIVRPAIKVLSSKALSSKVRGA